MNQQKLKELIVYDPISGQMIWKAREGNAAFNAQYGGKVIGTAMTQSHTTYLVAGITIDGKMTKHLCHRLAWLYVYGYMPELIDHIDGNGLNNALSNLREATARQNAANVRKVKGKTLPKGIRRMKSGKYIAQLRTGEKRISKTFIEMPEAIDWRNAMYDKYNGDFSRYE